MDLTSISTVTPSTNVHSEGNLFVLLEISSTSCTAAEVQSLPNQRKKYLMELKLMHSAVSFELQDPLIATYFPCHDDRPYGRCT